jgi:hypothetical protein
MQGGPENWAEEAARTGTGPELAMRLQQGKSDPSMTVFSHSGDVQRDESEEDEGRR